MDLKHVSEVIAEGHRLLNDRWQRDVEQRADDYQACVERLIGNGVLTRTKAVSFPGTKQPSPMKLRALLAQAEAEQIIAEGAALLHSGRH